MNNNCIGVFDSGLGGLTAVKELIEILPDEKIIYFGDTGRVPYGTRSKETIIKYVRQDINFLMTFNVKAIVVACGTASTITTDLRHEYKTPIIDVVTGTIEAALLATKNKKIGIIGTPATISFGVYEKNLKTIDGAIKTISQSCPLFVPAVENGRFKKGDPLIKLLVVEYLSKIKQEGVDTLILGCTHYPLLKAAISSYLGYGVTLIDSGECAAISLKKHLTKNNLLAHKRLLKENEFYVSDNVYNFKNVAAQFLQKEIDCIKKIDIEKY